MKVLLVHNFYGSSAPSGENTALLAEAGLLRQQGHTVIEFTKHSDTIRKRGSSGAILGALSTPWNPFALAELRKTLHRERPDIMHVHNTFPLISPAVFHAAGGSGLAKVMTLRNYRIFFCGGGACTGWSSLQRVPRQTDGSPCPEIRLLPREQVRHRAARD